MQLRFNSHGTCLTHISCREKRAKYHTAEADLPFVSSSVVQTCFLSMWVRSEEKNNHTVLFCEEKQKKKKGAFTVNERSLCKRLREGRPAPRLIAGKQSDSNQNYKKKINRYSTRKKNDVGELVCVQRFDGLTAARWRISVIKARTCASWFNPDTELRWITSPVKNRVRAHTHTQTDRQQSESPYTKFSLYFVHWCILTRLGNTAHNKISHYVLFIFFFFVPPRAPLRS